MLIIIIYSNINEPNDELLEKEIEEKEKILAKMLDLESLSIDTPKPEPELETFPEPPPPTSIFKQVEVQPEPQITTPAPVPPKTSKKDPDPVNLVPKLVQLPNTWNLENIELKLDLKQNGFKDRSLISPDDHLDSEWEII